MRGDLISNRRESMPWVHQTRTLHTLAEFKKFLGFMRNLWSILAGVSLFFPLSNTFTRLVPLAKYDNGGGLIYFSPQLVTAISTLACLFVILWTFGKRHQFTNQRKRQSIQKQAKFSFVWGVAALIVYLVVHFAVKTNFYFTVLGWESADIRRVLGDIVLLSTYSAFFLLVTRAFMLLGMMAYFSKKGDAA